LLHSYSKKKKKKKEEEEEEERNFEKWLFDILCNPKIEVIWC
jgi:hypothetical protein